MRKPALQLYEYQKRVLLDTARFILLLFSRQTGKTFTVTLKIVDECMQALVRRRRCRWVILSRSERQAEIAIKACIQHCKAYALGFQLHDEEFVSDDGKRTYKQLRVTLSDGIEIIGVPANPDTARGFSANVFMDEFAIHKNAGEIWAAIFPIVSAGFKLIVASTPKGKGNKFHSIATGNDPIWSRHFVDIYQAVEQGLPRDIDALKRAIDDDDIWAQEFECRFLDEASAWLPFDEILACEDPAAGKPENYGGGICFAGNDIAARRHLWVLWIMELVGDVLWTREIIVRKRASFAEQDALMDDAFERYRIARLVMDQTGIGEKPVEDARRRHGAHIVEGVIFNVASKLELANAGKRVVEDRKCRFPEGDEALRKDLHKLKKEVTSTGTPRFVADEDEGGHADRAWSFFMAAHAAQTPVAPIEYESERGLVDLSLSDFVAMGGGAELIDMDKGFGTAGGDLDLGGFC